MPDTADQARATIAAMRSTLDGRWAHLREALREQLDVAALTHDPTLGLQEHRQRVRDQLRLLADTGYPGAGFPTDQGGSGDIGGHFPDTNAAFKGADSHALLQAAAQRVRAAGYAIVNVDSTIVAQAPKMAPHVAAMCERIAEALGIDSGSVNVKAKTAEKMGPVGRGESMQARAVCLLWRA